MLLRPSDRAWLTLAGAVVVWDAVCPRGEMLSEASGRYVAARPLLARVLIVYTAGHLMHVWPPGSDAFTLVARAFGR